MALAAVEHYIGRRMRITNIVRRPIGANGTGARWLSPGLAGLLVVYLVWGSTYLGLRVGVRGDGGFPPFMLGTIRLAVASAIVLTWARLRGDSLGIDWRSALRLAVAGCLLWVGGNGLVTWAVTRVDSGYAALVMATIPMWVALMESVLNRRWPTTVELKGLSLGFVGIGVLSWPNISAGSADLVGLVALVAAAICWGAGSVYQRQRPVEVSGLVNAGYQLLFAAIGFGVVSMARGEPMPSPSLAPVLALSYLIVFGSVIAFACYVYALRSLPATLVMTHAYVNPVIALLLGWVFLAEPLTLWTWAGSVLVLLGVVVMFRRKGG